MASNAISGVNTKFRKWDTSAWVTISEITNISGPGMSRETIDVTSLDSDGGYREFIGSFRDGGNVTLTMNFTRAGLDLMQGDFETDDVQYYEIVLPDAVNTSFEFAGFVQEFPLTIAADQQITMETTIKVSGAVTVNSGSASSTPG